MKVLLTGAAALCWALVLQASAALEIHGSGTTNPSKLFWQIMGDMQGQARSDIRLTYRAVGSGTGQREFSQVADGDYSGGLTDFGSGDIPMSNARWTGMRDEGRHMVHVPFALGAIALFHSVPVGELGAEGLQLKPCTLAKIFKGDITTWDDAAIKTDSPGLQVPAGTKIEIGHRRLGSSSTGGLTGYLRAACPTEWSDTMTGSLITWPALDNFHEVEGSPGMTDHVAGKSYAIGYLDAGHGHQRGFQEVKLQNLAETWLTSTDAINANDTNGNNGIAAAGKAAVDGGTIPADATADWSAVDLYNQAGSNTWPIVLVSYIYVHHNMSTWSDEKVSLLKMFVDYVRGASMGETLLPAYSFNKIPTAMDTWSNAWANTIVKPDGYADVFSFEESTTAWTGQGMNIISVKRDTYAMWKIGELDIASKSMDTRLVELESHLNEYGMVPLHGSGTTNPRNWFGKVMMEMEHQARVPLLLTYRAVGSTTGQKEFVGDAGSMWMSYSHFGAGDIPMTKERYDILTSHSKVMLHLPFALGAIGIFHSVPLEAGQELKLTGCLLAKIFQGDITTWDDAEIAAENSGLTLPAETIKVGHRTEGSSSTGGLTGYLNKNCNAWNLGAGSTATWPTKPSKPGFTPVQGSQGMQNHLSNTPYAIGYLDAGHGHDFGFSEVALANAAGVRLTSKQSMANGGIAEAGTEAINNNVFPPQASDDWSAVNLFDMPGQHTWPIVLVSYLYVREDMRHVNPRTAAALKAFIDTILDDTDNNAARFSFTAPSASLRSKAKLGAQQINFPPGTDMFQFETDTLPLTGMGVNYISKKRTSYSDYRVEQLQRDIAMLSSALADLEANVSGSSPSPTPPPSAPQPQVIQQQTTEEEDSTTGTVALILAIIALLISAAAVVMGCMLGKGGGSTGSSFNGAAATSIGNSH